MDMTASDTELGPELEECPNCGLVGVRERIEKTDCPHGGLVYRHAGGTSGP